MKLENPFRPGSAIDPRYFVGREKELEQFRTYLKTSKEGNPQNIAVLGERGIGKTSLLRKFENIAEKSNCLAVRGELDESINSLSALTEYILTLTKDVGETKGSIIGLKSARDFFRDYNFDGFTIDLKLLETEASRKSPPIQIGFRRELKKIWDNVRKDSPAVVIMLDEAEHLGKIEGSLSLLRNVFSRLSEERCGYLFIISGKLDLFRKIKKIHSPMARFFRPMELGFLSPEESKEAIEKPLSDKGISISNEVKELIVRRSQGHPFIIQTMGFYLYENSAEIIDIEVYEKAYPHVMDALVTQLFYDLYSDASPTERRVLEAISKLDLDTFSPSDISEVMGKGVNWIAPKLSDLVKKGCIGKIERGRYELFHPLFREYVKSLS